VNRSPVGRAKEMGSSRKKKLSTKYIQSNHLRMWVFNVYRVFALFSKQFEQFRLATATKSRTQSHDNGEEDGACATRFSASALHRFTFTLVGARSLTSKLHHSTPHHTH